MSFRSVLATLTFLSLGVASLPAQVTWNVLSGNWSSGGSWLLGSAPANDGSASIDFGLLSAFTSTVDTNYSINSLTVQSGALSFTMNNSGGHTLTISSAFTDSSSNSVAVSVPLLGSMNLVVNGTGTLTLSGTNTYTGSTTVNSGMLQAGSTSAFGNLSAVSITGSGTLDLNNYSNTIGKLNSTSTSSSITLGSGTLTIGTAAINSTFEGTISGTGGLTLNNGDGYTLTLTGANTYSGTTTITNGTLLAENTSGSAIGTGPITISSGAVLQVGSLSTNGAIGTANIADNGTLTFARTDSITIPNTISGFGGVTVDRGTVTLSGNNTYSGITSIFDSTIDAGSATALGHLSTVNLSTSGALVLNGNNITVGNISGDSTTSINLGSNTLTLGNYVSSTTFAGSITGAGSLDVNVISSLDLTGNSNTYSGGTTIASGTLIADNTSGSATGSGAITITQSGATLEIGNDSATGLIANLPITDNGLIDFARTDSITFPNAISGTGGIEAQDGGVITLTGANTYSGITNVTGATFIAGSTSAFGNGTSALSLASGGTINLNGYSNTFGSIVGNAGTFIVLGSGTITTGATGGTNIYSGVISGTGGLDVAAPGNVVLAGANTYTGPTSVASGARLQLGFSDGATGSIAGSSGVSGAGTLEYDLSSSTAFSGTLSGALNVTQAGTGTTTLSGTNTYSGATSITAGKLQAGSTSAFGTLSAVTVSTGSTLALNGLSNAIGSLAGGGSVTLGSGALTVGTGSSNTLFSGVISGTGALNSVGYVLDLTGSNTYSGATTISNGTLLADNASGYATGTGNITVSSGALQIGNSNDSSGNIDPTSNITVNGTGSVSFSRGDSFAFANNITGTGGVGQYGTGTVTLSGNNTYSGVTTIFRGTMKAGSASAFGGATGLSELYFPNSASLDLNGFSNTVGSIYGIAGNSILLGSQTLTVAATSGSQTFAGNISGAGGSLAITGSGATTVLDGANTYTGGTTIWNGATLSIGDGTATGASLSGNVVNNGQLKFAPSSTDSSVFSGVISGSGFVTVLGTLNGSNIGSITLSGNNSYTGGTTVSTGELFVGSNSAAGGGTLTFDQDTEFSPSASVTLSNPIVLNGTGYIDNDDGGSNDLTLNGQISGTNGIAWCTWSTLTLTGNNTFQYGIDMRDGMLLLGSDTAAGTGTILLDTGTTLSAQGTGVTRVIPNAITMVGSSATLGNNDNNKITISGVMSSWGTSTTTYAGGSSGTLTLTANNSGLTGPFTIASGTVIAGNNNALGASSETVSLTGGAGLNVMTGVAVSNPLSFSGAANVLSGSGTIASAPVTVNSSVVLSPNASPGNGPGDLTFSNSLTLASGGAIHFDLYDATGAAGTGYSEITANGGLSLTASANTLTFNLVSIDSSGNPAAAINFNPANSYSWMFATSSTAITGFSASDFHLVTGGFSNSTAGGSFSFTESGDNLFLNFTPVPEPSTWVLLGSGLLAVVPLALSRRRRSRA